MDVSKYMGNYLKAEDFLNKPPMKVTVSAVQEQTVGREGEQQQKLVLQFTELEKMLLLNATNLKIACLIFKSTESNDWVGKKCMIKHDPTVQFKGKFVGGLKLGPVE